MEMNTTIVKAVLSGVTNPFSMTENVDGYVDYVKTARTIVLVAIDDAIYATMEEGIEEDSCYTTIVLNCIYDELDAIVEMAKVKHPTIIEGKRIRRCWDNLDKLSSILDIVTDDSKTVEQQKEAVNIAQMLLIGD
jgi:hypothetical protein